MTWKQCLDLGPTKLSALLGCPVTTASSWIRRSGPPDWLQPILAAHATKAQQDAAQNQPSAASRSGRKASKGKR